MKKLIKIFRATIGVILFLLMLTTFIIDRIILVFLPHVESKAIQDIYMKSDRMSPIFTRVTTIVLIILIYKLITYLIF
jgi:hypothetical protein